MGGLIELLIYFLVFALIVYLVFWVISLFKWPEPVRIVLTSIVGLAFLLYLLRMMGIL